MSPEHIRIQIRLPAELHARLVKAASESTRSLNGEMVYRLQDSFDLEDLELDGNDSESARLLEFEQRLRALEELQDAITSEVDRRGLRKKGAGS